VARLSKHLMESRLVTVVGPGGVGKTTVALAVAHQLAETFAGAVLFVDFSMLSEPRLVATALATMLGLPVQSETPTPALVQFLKRRRLLLILDTCEHLIDAVAEMAMAIISAAPQTRILATSREALRLDGEHVYRLDTLPCPEEESILASAALQQYAATQLFIERATANGAKLDLDEPAAAIVCDICRKLDGVALAIELAARRVDSYGLEQTAALLDQRLGLLWQGSRSSPPRHKTLHATLEWSYELLSVLERAVLRRLTVFVGHFTLDAALEVTSDAKVDRRLVVGAIDSLVEKSMVAARPLGAMMRYRLLDATRAYVLELGDADSEMTPLAARHASYYRRWLERTGNEWSSLSTGMDRAPHFNALNNVRAALNWSFGEFGDTGLGIGLAAAAAPVLRAMGLMPECRRWAERALAALDDTTRGGSEEMQLQASVGLALMFASGHSDAAFAALRRSLDIAEARGDRLNEARLLGQLTFYHLRGGEFRACREYAERCSAIASTLDDPGVSALAHTLMGIAFSILGALPEAHRELNAALEIGRSPASRAVFFGFDHHHWAEIALVSTRWMRGYTEETRRAIDQAFKDAEAMHHPVAWAIVLNAVAVLLWVGDLDVAERRLDWFISRARSSSFTPYFHIGHAFKGELAIRRGDFDAGVEAIQDHLSKLHEARYELFTTRLQIVLAGGLASSDRVPAALTLLAAVEQTIDMSGYLTYLPELLRVKGAILLSCQQAVEAESSFFRSLEVSRTHGSRVWELKTAVDLAELWVAQGKAAEAREFLQPILAGVAPDMSVEDLKAGRMLLFRLE
jgi:predicted ATPase